VWGQGSWPTSVTVACLWQSLSVIDAAIPVTRIQFDIGGYLVLCPFGGILLLSVLCQDVLASPRCRRWLILSLSSSVCLSCRLIFCLREWVICVYSIASKYYFSSRISYCFCYGWFSIRERSVGVTGFLLICCLYVVQVKQQNEIFAKNYTVVS